MTKAERIFKDTKIDCKKSMQTWGKEVNPNGKPVGFTHLSYGSNDCLYAAKDETVSIRTCNDIQKLINSGKKIASMDLRLGIFSQEKYDDEMFVLEMVQVTLNNQIKIINAIKEC